MGGGNADVQQPYFNPHCMYGGMPEFNVVDRIADTASAYQPANQQNTFNCSASEMIAKSSNCRSNFSSNHVVQQQNTSQILHPIQPSPNTNYNYNYCSNVAVQSDDSLHCWSTDGSNAATNPVPAMPRPVTPPYIGTPTAAHIDRFYFSHDRLAQTPARRIRGLSFDADVNERTHLARRVHCVGQTMAATNLSICTAITLMNRFYLYHDYTIIDAEDTVPASLRLACKIEENLAPLRRLYKIQQQPHELGGHTTEQLLLQTFGFDTWVRHPHVTVLRACKALNTSAQFTSNAYAIANWSLLVTIWCVQYQPELVACAVIHVTCKQLGVWLPLSADGQPWYVQFAESATREQLDRMRMEYIEAYEDWTMQAFNLQYLNNI